jgi:hypothetical protein
MATQTNKTADVIVRGDARSFRQEIVAGKHHLLQLLREHGFDDFVEADINHRSLDQCHCIVKRRAPSDDPWEIGVGGRTLNILSHDRNRATLRAHVIDPRKVVTMAKARQTHDEEAWRNARPR